MDKEEYRRILEYLQGKVDDKKLWKQADTFEVKNGKLYKKKKDGRILRVLQEDEIPIRNKYTEIISFV